MTDTDTPDLAIPAGFALTTWRHLANDGVTDDNDDLVEPVWHDLWSITDASGCVIVAGDALPTQADVDAATDEHTGTLALVFASLAATLGPVL